MRSAAFEDPLRIAESDLDRANVCAFPFHAAEAKARILPPLSIEANDHDRQHVAHVRVAHWAAAATGDVKTEFCVRTQQMARALTLGSLPDLRERLQVLLQNSLRSQSR